jgi:hypothetical protein
MTFTCLFTLQNSEDFYWRTGLRGHTSLSIKCTILLSSVSKQSYIYSATRHDKTQVCDGKSIREDLPYQLLFDFGKKQNISCGIIRHCDHKKTKTRGRYLSCIGQRIDYTNARKRSCFQCTIQNIRKLVRQLYSDMDFICPWSPVSVRPFLIICGHYVGYS